MEQAFTDLLIKPVYLTGDDNLYEDFYRPVLEKAIRYDRAVGFFSSEILNINLKGLSYLLRNNGKMRLIIGEPLKPEEYEAIKRETIEQRNLRVDNYIERLLEMIDKDEQSNRLHVLAYLVAANLLEIKFAIRNQGMYHQKIGIVYDNFNNSIVFQGSANETPSALLEHLNSECISVYKSWQGEIFEAYGQNYINIFENLWSDNYRDTLVLDVLSEHYDKVIRHLKKQKNLNALSTYNFNIQAFREELTDQDDLYEFSFNNLKYNIPEVPTIINGQNFVVRPHQRQALTKWAKNRHKGILQHATGSGKTITSIYGLTRIYQEKNKKGESLACIITVPYIELAKQWVHELKNFNIIPIECFESKNKWYESFERNLGLFLSGQLDFICLLVVNKTLTSDAFQNLLKKIPSNNLFLIGDECHRHAAENTYNALPNAYFRLGLSATPFHDDDEDMEFENIFPNLAKDRLLNYYQSIVDDYTLENAILDGVLTPYNYHIITVYLTEEEQEKYDEISEKITKIIVNSGGNLSAENQNNLMIYSSERTRLLGRAENKLFELKKITSNINALDKQYGLFYVGEGKTSDYEDNRVIDEVSKILTSNSWKTAQFIGATSPQKRKEILELFKLGKIDALVAMKVLDEGIDVPACKTAYILASSKNPRQYVQRRGRVLRKFSGKNFATIYDFVILPNPHIHSEFSKKLIKSEMERIKDFTLLATNKVEIENIIDKLGLRNE